MYTCLFCRGYLGQNEIVEHCTAGRRLAFDSKRGRLWVVCPHCSGWNLTPLDERWEALEECELLFRSTAVRVHTENIGMAVLYGELDLIRIGTPLRQELAIWRYANQLKGRRRKAFFRAGARAADRFGWMMGAGGLVGASVALLAGTPAIIGVGMMAGVGTEELWREIGPEKIERFLGRVIAKVRINTLDYSYVRTRHVPELRVAEHGHGWRLELPHSVGWEGYEGSQATNILSVMLPIANGFGASHAQVLEAVYELDEAGSVEAYIETAARRLQSAGYGKCGVGSYPMPTRLALEMAAHEETERRALQGHLKWLERRWQEAEEIAEIADNLFATPTVESVVNDIERWESEQ
jgi:hypothetical protein